ncbi:fimbrial protein [Chromobacterium haemolyticum]|uniref:fimbrial protein n=1 Tax=Chromobacterium haemolyticum TaxID=394935 RepID=UPI0013162D22|nr:fimbrial protein [Chromobacterium haemolyticum]BBH11648.1 fimbrial protein [Chromobacterium haemolyticum]
MSSEMKVSIKIKCVALLAVLGGMLSAQAEGACYRVSRATPSTNPNANDYVEPDKGVVAVWDSPGIGHGGGSEAVPASININSSRFQPDGTLLSSGVAPSTSLGRTPYLSPEQVLFRCDAADQNQVYEYYTTNGPYPLTGMHEDGSKFGVERGYRTRYQGVVSRLTNLADGMFFQRHWQRRLLTGLDADSQGKLLIKVKNFTNIRVELFRVSNEEMSGCAGCGGGGDGLPAQGGTGIGGGFPFDYGIAYTVFKGPGVGSGVEYVNTDSNSNYPDYNRGNYIGAVKFYDKLYINRSATCAVSNVTPVVSFPRISAQQLNAGEQRELPLEIHFSCQTGPVAEGLVNGMSSGTGRGQTAMGVLVQPANYQSAVHLGLTSSGSGATHLLSDGYGSVGVAAGVGVTLTREQGSETMNFLGNEWLTLGGRQDGWYPVLSGASETGRPNGETAYSTRLRARLTKLPGMTATAGRFHATVQAVIRVQ